MTRRTDRRLGPLDPGEDAVRDDLERAELVESASFQNTWAILGPASLVLIPLAKLLAGIDRLVRGRT